MFIKRKNYQLNMLNVNFLIFNTVVIFHMVKK